MAFLILILLCTVLIIFFLIYIIFSKTSPTAVHPTRVSEPPKGFYQPDILAPGPLSPPQLPRSVLSLLIHFLIIIVELIIL